MSPVDPDDLRWRYRLRIALFLLFAALALFASSTVWRTAVTLRHLEVVEAERDRWQQPEQVVRALDLRPERTVVDLGCGAGYFALKLSPAVGQTGRVVAVDVRTLPLQVLRWRALLGGRHNLQIERGEADDPHLAPGSADAVLIANTWHELRDRPRILAPRPGSAASWRPTGGGRPGPRRPERARRTSPGAGFRGSRVAAGGVRDPRSAGPFRRAAGG